MSDLKEGIAGREREFCRPIFLLLDLGFGALGFGALEHSCDTPDLFECRAFKFFDALI